MAFRKQVGNYLPFFPFSPFFFPHGTAVRGPWCFLFMTPGDHFSAVAFTPPSLSLSLSLYLGVSSARSLAAGSNVGFRPPAPFLYLVPAPRRNGMSRCALSFLPVPLRTQLSGLFADQPVWQSLRYACCHRVMVAGVDCMKTLETRLSSPVARWKWCFDALRERVGRMLKG